MPITEFVALTANCYFINHLKINETIKNTNKSKGASKDVAKHQRTNDNYMDTMTYNGQVSRDVVSLRSNHHDKNVQEPKKGSKHI